MRTDNNVKRTSTFKLPNLLKTLEMQIGCSGPAGNHKWGQMGMLVPDWNRSKLAST
jgi:hypothetical protein